MVGAFHNSYCLFEDLDAIRGGGNHSRVTGVTGLSKGASAPEIFQDRDLLGLF